MPKLKKRPDGRYLKQIKDPSTGKKLCFYGKTEREVNQKILEYSSKKKEGYTFQEVADKWWKVTLENIEIQTVKGYRRAMQCAIERFGKMHISEITPKDIDNYLHNMAQKGYAQKTVTNYRLIINLIYEYAVVEGFAQYNACASVKVPKGLKKTKRTSATQQEEETIRRTEDEWIYPKIVLYTGMRKGEVLALQWQDIDFDQNLIHVAKSVGHAGNIPFIKLPKTEKGIRDIPLLQPLKELLLKQPNREPSNFIISIDGTKPLAEHEYQRLYNKFRQETGITSTAHQMRHSYATIAFEADVPPKAVQYILGHAQLSTTMDIYTDFRKKALESAAETLNKKMQSVKNQSNDE
jgi:integrase